MPLRGSEPRVTQRLPCWDTWCDSAAALHAEDQGRIRGLSVASLWLHGQNEHVCTIAGVGDALELACVGPVTSGDEGRTP